MFTWICGLSHTHYVLLSRAGCTLPGRAGQGQTLLVVSCHLVMLLQCRGDASNNGLRRSLFYFHQICFLKCLDFILPAPPLMQHFTKLQDSDYYALSLWDWARGNMAKKCKGRVRFSLLSSPCLSQHPHNQGLPSTAFLYYSTCVHTKNTLLKQISCSLYTGSHSW